MNYIGSKRKLSDFIKSSIIDVVGNTENKVFAELFGGTGVVARKFKKYVKKVIINDIEPYSYILLRNYIGNHQNFYFFDLIQELNFTPGIEGFIFHHYCQGGGQGRNYFTDENGQRIDAIRQRIEQWHRQKKINENQYYFLLASLLESADKVANTASVYGAFLKHIKDSARKPLLIQPAVFTVNEQTHDVYNRDANELIREIEGDILYLDPPYNARQYGANYHLLNTIALYDKFDPRGKTGLREYYRSPYCKSRRVVEVLEDLIANARFEYVFVSYNNEGLMTTEQVKEILSNYGEYHLIVRPYQRFRADKPENRLHKADATEEYLHVLHKKMG